MAVRQDKFKVGDRVRWNPDLVTLTSTPSRLGDGPFTIKLVYDRSLERGVDEEGGQSNWHAMGHTQHVVVEESLRYEDGEEQTFSGAFFLKDDPS